MTLSYKLIANVFGVVTAAKRMEEGQFDICLPFDPGNHHYAEYLRWLEEGNTPLPPDPEPTPEPLTAQQKLEAAGLTVEELKDLLGL